MKYLFYGEMKSGLTVDEEITKEAYHNIKGWINTQTEYLELMFPERPNKIMLIRKKDFEYYSVDAHDS